MDNLFHLWLPLAARFISSHRRKSLATGLFIAVGTAVLVFMHAMTMGITDTMVLNTTSLHTGHVFTDYRTSKITPITAVEKIMKEPEVLVALPRYRFVGTLVHDKDAIPSQIFGVKTEEEQKTTAIAGRIIEGSYPSQEEHEALIGKKMAESLKLHLEDKVNIWQAGGIGLGEFTIKGIFNTGIERFDNGTVYIPMETLYPAIVKRSNAEVAIFLRDPAKADSVVSKLNAPIPPKLKIKFLPWTELMPDLVQLIKLNTVSTAILMILVFALVGFGIANIFVLTIVDRFRELGILKAMGMTPSEIVFLVFLESFMVFAIATLAGLLTGWAFSAIAATTGIDLGALTSHNRYFVVSGVVFPRITIAGLVWPAIISFVISLIASWLPARIVARRLTAEALRAS